MSGSIVALQKRRRTYQHSKEKCGIFVVETVVVCTYICQETTILLRIVNWFISVIDVEECLLHRAEQVDPGLQLDLGLVSLSFCRDESDELAFRCNIVSVRATEHVPAIGTTKFRSSENRHPYMNWSVLYICALYDVVTVLSQQESIRW